VLASCLSDSKSANLRPIWRVTSRPVNECKIAVKSNGLELLFELLEWKSHSKVGQSSRKTLKTVVEWSTDPNWVIVLVKRFVTEKPGSKRSQRVFYERIFDISIDARTTDSDNSPDSLHLKQRGCEKGSKRRTRVNRIKMKERNYKQRS